jgi:hypothetical protein
MAELTAYKSPTATSSSISVTDPDNAWTSNDQYAVFDSVIEQATYASFGDFEIPATAVILGIEISVEGKYTGSGVNHSLGFSIRDGIIFWAGDNDTFTPTSTSDDTYLLGGATDEWGNVGGWAVSDFANGTFQVKVTCSSISVTSIDLDHFQVRVYYQVPNKQPTISPFPSHRPY